MLGNGATSSELTPSSYEASRAKYAVAHCNKAQSTGAVHVLLAECTYSYRAVFVEIAL
jgi:hypothetical protein